ncbi:MAG TPA: hypothetical protein VK034_05550 [Enhygromyxa sp.]|nr:hypothetical protein [Enhygromyxa sp.]
MSDRVHVSGIRLAHVDCAERTVQVNRPAIHEGPIQWEKPVRGPDGKVRLGRGKSGLSYRIKQAREWQVQVVASRGRELLVGSARLQDHALALAGMWEQAVLAGRVDVD